MRLGIAGAGKIVSEMLPVVSGINEIEITSIYARSDKDGHVSDLCTKYNIKNMYLDYNDMLNDSTIDVIYVAVTNEMHFKFALQALKHGKNVISEKPFTVDIEEFNILRETAKKYDLFLWEAITTLYLPNFTKIKNRINDIGRIKIVECNFSQYSSRYLDFTNGKDFPVFKKECAGGALMDLNIYNIHGVCSLFGEPKDAIYYPNIERGIDVSGILILDYGDFKCSLIGAKDCTSDCISSIEGDRGFIEIEAPLNSLDKFSVKLNGKEKEVYDFNLSNHRMYFEFKEFCRMFEENDKESMYKKLDQSEIVMKVITKARNYL